MKKISEIMIIKQNNNINGIDSYLLYRDYNNEILKLNVFFNTGKVDEILLKNGIKQSNSSL